MSALRSGRIRKRGKEEEAGCVKEVRPVSWSLVRRPSIVAYALPAWEEKSVDVSCRELRAWEEPGKSVDVSCRGVLEKRKKPVLPRWPGEAPVSKRRRRRSAQPFEARDFAVLARPEEAQEGSVVVACLVSSSEGAFSARTPVALKIFEKKKLLASRQRASLLFRERRALGLVHPFLCEMLFAFQTATRCYAGMRYYAGGSLRAYAKDKSLSFGEARFYGAEIASGLSHLHGRDLVHRDLKAENVLVDFDGHVVLADFGLVARSGTLVRDAFVGTAHYSAPECLRKNHVLTPAIDYWALGILLYELLTHKRPFQAKTLREEWENILNDDDSWKLSKSSLGHQTKKHRRRKTLAQEAIDTGNAPFDELLRRLLAKKPHKRLSTFTEFKGLSFFQDLDWDKLLKKAIEAPSRPQNFPPFLHEDGIHLKPHFDLSNLPSLHHPDDDKPQPDRLTSAFSGFALFLTLSTTNAS